MSLQSLPLVVSVVLGAGLALGSLAAPRAAHACGSTPCAQRMEVLPGDGATSIPTNTELRVLYFGTLEGYANEGPPCVLPLSRMRLVDGAGVAIELEAVAEEAGVIEAWMVARPSEALQPRAHYSLEVLVGANGSDCTCGNADSWTEISEFTTGEDADEEPPAFQGVDRMELSARVDGSSTCGRTVGFPVQVAFEPAADASPDVRYDVYVDGQIAARYVGSFEHELFVDCGSTALFLGTQLMPGARVQVRAVDLAGNASELGPEHVIEAECAPAAGAAGAGGGAGAGDDDEIPAPTTPVPSAAGSGAEVDRDDDEHSEGGDAGMQSPSPSDPSTIATDGGCAVSRSRTPAALIGWLFALAAALLRRRS